MLDDSPEALADPDHQRRWADWLPWSNLLQFLGRPHDPSAAVIAATSQASSGASDELRLRHLASGGAQNVQPATEAPSTQSAGRVELDPEQLEQLDLLDPPVAELVRTVLELGAPGVTAGHELPDGSIVEAAWPDERVGIIIDGQQAPAGWNARNATDWTGEDLRAALRSATPGNGSPEVG